VDNPFRFGEVVGGDHFTDRTAEREQLFLDMRSGQNVVLISPRRFGKTSLLFEVAAMARQAECLVAYVDLAEASNKDRLVSLLAGELYRDLANMLERVRDKAQTLITSVHPQITATVGESGVTWSFTPVRTQRDADDAIKRLLELPQQLATERKKRVVVILDEFQALLDIDPDLITVMRSVFQRQPDVCHVFAGSQQHLMRKIFNATRQSFYRSARPITLGSLPEDEARQFIRERCRSSGVKVSAAVAADITRRVRCRPYELQQLASTAWNLSIARTRTIDSKTVEDAWTQMLLENSVFYDEVWRGCSHNARVVLEALALGASQGLLSRSVQLAYRLPGPSATQFALTGLVGRELVVEAHRGARSTAYAIPDPVFRAWIVRSKRI
jgi:hypothetical protein